MGASIGRSGRVGLSSPLFTFWIVRVSIWDILLLIMVSVMGMALAYLHHPKWKAVMLTLPIPFSLAFLSVGKPMDVTNIAGLLALLAFTHAVRVLHQDWRVPILPAIVIPAAGYCLIGTLLAGILPKTTAAFWVTFALVMGVGLALYLSQLHREEPGHRTPLPIWLKLPLMASVVAFLVIIKLLLQGFMTVFPMVGVIAAYEARKSLWTNCRAIPVIMISMGPMMASIFVTQHWLPPGAALAIGWGVLLSILLPLTREIWTVPTEHIPLPAESTWKAADGVDAT